MEAAWLSWPVLLAIALAGLLLRAVRAAPPKLKLPPGPLALPVVGSWLQVGSNLSHHLLTDLAKRYGEIMLLRMGQRSVVVVSSPDLAREVLHSRGAEFGSRCGNPVIDVFSGGGKDMNFAPYGQHWRTMRRIVALPLFTHKAVQRWRPVWEEEIDALTHDMATLARTAPPAQGIAPRPSLQLMMYNITYRMLFNRRFESSQDPLFLRLRALNAEGSRLLQSFHYSYADFIPVLKPFLRGFLQRCRTLRDDRHKLFMEHFIEERRRQLLNTEDKHHSCKGMCGIDYILESQANGEIDEQSLLYLVQNISAGALETTPLTIEWALSELVNHPQIQQRVRDEAESVLGRGVKIRQADVGKKLPFLVAVVKETLRHHMIVPLLLPHMNLHAAKLGGYDIPAESRVLVNAWWLGHNPELWEDPEEFRPDRFMELNVEASGNDMRFIPFGGGRRSCPGIILALPILAMAIGRLVTEFELLQPVDKENPAFAENGGQISRHTLSNFRMVLKPICT